MKPKASAVEMPFLLRPRVGNLLTIAAGLSFYFLCMILPLVGPAAMRGSGSPGAGPVPHARANYLTFLGVLLLSMFLAGLALFSKLGRRRLDRSPFPWHTFGLLAIEILILIALLTGLIWI